MAERDKNVNGYFAFSDLPNFKSGIESHEYREKYDELKEIIGDLFQEDKKANICMVSDSIIITSKHLCG
jgi:predicted AlkP superfamily pyrophosphatase or phosphodiesterase